MKKMILIIIFVCFCSFVFAQAGTLDPTFDGDGIAIFPLGAGTLHDVGNDVIAQSDGSLLVCGVLQINDDFFGILMRILEDGSQDMTFGDNGITIMQFGLSTYAYQMELLEDGKILVSGLIYINAFDADIFLARYLPDGSIDTTFGTNGYSVTAYTTSDDYCNAMLLQDDGKIIIAGKTNDNSFSSMLFARFTPDGFIDTSFGNNGFTIIDESSQDETICALGFLSDGTIIGVGDGFLQAPYWGHLVRMVKLDADGIPISTFGNNGVLVPPIFDDGSKAYGLRIIDDCIYITGYVYGQTAGTDIFLVKLDSEGNTDPSFGTNGINIIQPTPNHFNNIGLDILISSDEYIYICGSSGYNSFTLDFILLRCTMDGVLDPEFNGSGFVITQIGTDFDEANAMDMQLDGKMVLAGFKADFSAANDIALARYFASEPVFSPPTNLAVVADTGLFTWNAPVSRDLTGYDVYLDSIFLENVTDTEFQFENLVYEQIYLAGVSAVYDEGTSEIIDIDFTYLGTGAGNNIVSNTGLIGNYPNPFNPYTTIEFSIEQNEQNEQVELIIYNLKGQKVKDLSPSLCHTELYPLGRTVEVRGGMNYSITWNGTDDNGKPVSSGVYIYKLKSGRFISTKKMILLK